MSTTRRELLGQAAAALGAAVVGRVYAEPVATPSSRPARMRVSDTVVLGRTGIRTSRLAIGTGFDSGREAQRRGLEGMVRVLRYGLDQGIRWWETADMYKTHPFVAAALKEVPRDKVVITSKTMTKDAAGVRADVERFRRELGTDYIDVLLLHCMQAEDWPKRLHGAMDALSEAKQKGWVRAVGCSCHTLQALQAAAEEPWVEVQLARFNPYGAVMDVPDASRVPEVEKLLETMHRRGKGVYGMKIIGEGKFKSEQIDRSLRFVLNRPYVNAFTIGFTQEKHIDDIIHRVEAVQS